jgi:Spondin_N
MILSPRKSLMSLAATALLAMVGSTAIAQESPEGNRVNYTLEIVNLTQAQQFTPVLGVVHEPEIQLFNYGEAPLPQLATLAEQGDITPLRDLLTGLPPIHGLFNGDGLTSPGGKVTLQFTGNPRRDRLSVAAMLIPTNDAFVALRGGTLPTRGKAVSYYLYAHDAGSEVNDELCASIPGPSFAECGGPGGGAAVGSGEGFVHMHNGIHGVGDLDPSTRDWRAPVAIIVITAQR